MKKILFVMIFLVLMIPFANAGLKEDLVNEQGRIEKEIPMTKFNSLLPIEGEGFCFDTNETVYVTIEKGGKMEFYGKGRDFYVEGKYKDMKSILMMDSVGGIAKNINKVDVYPRSIKGKIGVRFAEIFYGVKISASNSFGDKLINFITTPAAFLIRGLMKIF